MRKAILGAAAIVGIGVISMFALISIFDDKSTSSVMTPIFHETLARAKLYGDDGIYRNSFDAPAGPYELRFVPNGDSPARLGITITGPDVSFQETLDLFSTRQGNEPAIYYTWNYSGKKTMNVESDSTLDITINPYGNLLGPVSVSLVPR